jgi:cytidine deaminase
MSKETRQDDSGHVTGIDWDRLSDKAWAVRDAAHVLGTTKVGAAVLCGDGDVFLGCNVEHRFRSHDVHAEVNAITNMVSSGCQDLRAILIASERERFTPCGACLDWIFEFGGDSCVVAYQSYRGGDVVSLSAHDLMPYYPK